MLRINKLCILFVALSLSFPMGLLQAQQRLSEPYSRFGWGEMQPRTSAALRGMGTTGYAYSDPTVVNTLNPASYCGFDSLSSLIDAAFSFRSHSLREGGTRQQGSTAYMDYLYIGLPVSSRWATAFGFQPFSIVNYVYDRTEGSCTRHDEGQGGTYEVFWGNSLRVSRYLSVGLQASYLFGTSTRTHDLLFSDASYISSRSSDETRIRGLLLNAGLQLCIPVGKKTLGFGLTFTPSASSLLRERHSLLRTTFQPSGSSEVLLDTLAWSEADKSVSNRKLANPTRVGVGVSLSEKERFWAGADFTWTDWSVFPVGETDNPLADAARVSVGARWTPNANSSHYWGKITLLLGGFYESDYVMQGDASMYRSGLNAGLSFPVRKSKTRISAVAEVGNYRLPVISSGISEQYVSFTLQVQLHEKWYQRRKLD